MKNKLLISNTRKDERISEMKNTMNNRFISAREMKIIELLEKSLSNEEISKTLSIQKREMYTPSINNYRKKKDKHLLNFFTDQN